MVAFLFKGVLFAIANLYGAEGGALAQASAALAG